MTDKIRQEQLVQLQYLLGHGRTQSALELINLLSHYRFTAIYRITGDSLDNLMIVDRQTKSLPRLERMPVSDSYCVYVRDHLDAFLVQDADQDQRVTDHPKRPIVKAYCGVPLKRPDGSVFGTICHFDFDPVTDDPDAQLWLEHIANYFNPALAARTLIHGANVATDYLEAMLDLILDTSDDLETATESFSDFAAPITSQLQTLPPDAANKLPERLDGLRSFIAERFTQNESN